MVEIWKPIAGYEGYYEISNSGRIKSFARKNWNGTRIIAHIKGTRYLLVRLCKDNKPRTRLLHRLLAQAFIPNPDNLPQVNHIDGNRINNNLDNLEWVTARYNSLHATRMGLKGGERNRTAKLTVAQVREIRSLYPRFTYKEIGKMYGLNAPAIHKAVRGITWRYI